MKLSELTPCVACGGPIGYLFYRVTAEQIMLDVTAANQVLGLNTMFGGVLGLAEVFASKDTVVHSLQSNGAFVCDKCFCNSWLAVRVLFREGPREDGNDKHQP